MHKYIYEFLIHIKKLNRNLKLYLLTIFIFNLGFSIFRIDFNLYILSMGITADFLGIILSLTPFAQALASIPIGFLTEKIGFKRSLIMVNIIVGCTNLLRVISSNSLVILIGAFLNGVMACGYFIIQLPYISHYADRNKNMAFIFTGMVIAMARFLGSLMGGFLPNFINIVVMNVTISYRIVLTTFAMLTVVSTIPLLFLNSDKPDYSKEINLSPYLSNIDNNTVRFAIISFFVGFGMSCPLFFMNIIFVKYFNTSLELFGVIDAFSIIPMLLLFFLGPILAQKYTGIKVLLICRMIATVLAFLIIITNNPFFGGGAFILFLSFIELAQQLWFSFAVSVATSKSRMATSAWLEITFQIGLGIAALVGGKLISMESYVLLIGLAGLSIGVSFLLTAVFFGHKNWLAKIP